MTDYDTAMKRLLPHEGGYVNDPKDPGGETKFGISKRSYPKVDIKNLTWDQAKAIYKRDFWDKIQGDKLPMVVAYQLVDAAINSGIDRASRWVQRAVGATQDGDIGPATLAALKATDPNDVVFRFLGFRLQFMTDLPIWDRFGKGWARRIAANLLYAAEDN